MKTRLLVVLGLLLSVTQFGCPMASMPPGGSDALPDADGDGFGDLETPEGVDTTDEIAVELVNTLTKEQLTDLFDLSSIPLADVALNAINVNISFDATLLQATGDPFGQAVTVAGSFRASVLVSVGF